jgi:predicted O-methyltransferase YrrM
VKSLLFVWRFVIHRIKSVTEHNVNSTFITDLILQVINVNVEYYAYEAIENLRGQLLKSNKTVSIIDLGAGGNSDRKPVLKKIKDIVHSSAKDSKNAQLLFRLVNHFQPKNIVELGTNLGISTAYLAKGNRKANVITIEGSKNLASIAKDNFKHLKLKNTTQVVGDFDEVLKEVLGDNETLDFVFFDGNHRKAPTLKYFEMCLEKANENTVFVFDDIYWSAEMVEAWEAIKKHKQVTITIDTFYMGLVFFGKEQVEKHFRIRV